MPLIYKIYNVHIKFIKFFLNLLFVDVLIAVTVEAWRFGIGVENPNGLTVENELLIIVSSIDFKGALVRLVKRANMPFLGSHWKYLVPPTDPSFLPKYIYLYRYVLKLIKL